MASSGESPDPLHLNSYKGLPLLGSFPEFVRDSPKFLVKLSQSRGPLTEFRLGPRRVVFVGEPELIEQILFRDALCFRKSLAVRRTDILLGRSLINDDSDAYLPRRQLMSKAFTRKKLELYCEGMKNCTQTRAKSWQGGTLLNLSSEITTLTLEILTSSLFSHSNRDDAGNVRVALEHFQKCFPYMLLPGASLLGRFPLPQVLRIRRARSMLDETIYRLIDERLSKRSEHRDLLEMLLEARDETSSREDLTREQLRNELATIYLAGHETTAAALCWTIYLLCCNPNFYERLLAEVDQVLGECSVTVDNINNLELVRFALSESLRLFPPIWAFGRENKDEYQLGSAKFPEGTTFVVSPFVLGRDPRFFSEPSLYRPSRFENPSWPRCSYLPFGGGVRRCLGDRFAMQEAIVVLAMLSKFWRFRYENPLPATYRAAVTLRIDPELYLRLEAR